MKFLWGLELREHQCSTALLMDDRDHTTILGLSVTSINTAVEWNNILKYGFLSTAELFLVPRCSEGQAGPTQGVRWRWPRGDGRVGSNPGRDRAAAGGECLSEAVAASKAPVLESSSGGVFQWMRGGTGPFADPVLKGRTLQHRGAETQAGTCCAGATSRFAASNVF